MMESKILLAFALISLFASFASTYAKEAPDNYDNYERSYGVAFGSDQFPSSDGRIQRLLQTKRSIEGIKDFFKAVAEYAKRSVCSLDGGMGSACDHRDAVEAGQHHKFLESSFAPGRRKRTTSQQFTNN